MRVLLAPLCFLTRVLSVHRIVLRDPRRRQGSLGSEREGLSGFGSFSRTQEGSRRESGETQHVTIMTEEHVTTRPEECGCARVSQTLGPFRALRKGFGEKEERHNT